MTDVLYYFPWYSRPSKGVVAYVVRDGRVLLPSVMGLSPSGDFHSEDDLREAGYQRSPMTELWEAPRPPLPGTYRYFSPPDGWTDYRVSDRTGRVEFLDTSTGARWILSSWNRESDLIKRGFTRVDGLYDYYTGVSNGMLYRWDRELRVVQARDRSSSWIDSCMTGVDEIEQSGGRKIPTREALRDYGR